MDCFVLATIIRVIDIGQRIHDVVLHRQCNITQLAAELGCDRKSVYRLFQKTSIDSNLLMRLSLILHYDFFEEYHTELLCSLQREADCGNSATLLDTAKCK